MNYLTDQEDFWAGFLEMIILKEIRGQIFWHQTKFFSRILSKTNKLNSCLNLVQILNEFESN